MVCKDWIKPAGRLGSSRASSAAALVRSSPG